MTTYPSKVDIRSLRLAIGVLRRAELDWLSPTTPVDVKDSAKRLLFARKTSLLPSVCKVLNINPYAAKLTLILWKIVGNVGDPIFSYLTKEESLERHYKGEPLDIPDFERLSVEHARSTTANKQQSSPEDFK